MDRSAARVKKRLRKKARRGFRGYPLITLASYGPDDRRAKAVASIMEGEGDEPSQMHKWYSKQADVRDDATIMAEVMAFIGEFGALTVAMPDRIIGCPHEEGIDYDGPVCPECPFWANRDRWTGEVLRWHPSHGRGRAVARPAARFDIRKSRGRIPAERANRVRRNTNSSCAYVVPGIWADTTALAEEVL